MLEKKGHGIVNLRDALKVSCDSFYEMSRRLGVDRLNETAKKFGLGDKVFKNLFNERKEIFSSINRMEKKCSRKRVGFLVKR